MPTITLVAAPNPQATARDANTGVEFTLNRPVVVFDNDTYSRLLSLRALGYEFIESELENAAPAPAGAPDPTAEQAVAPTAPLAPAPQEP